MKYLRQCIRNILLESFNSYDKLSKEENLELRMLEHSKEHVNLDNNVAIAKAFQYYSETTTMPLYRGIYGPEERIISNLQSGDTFKLGRVTSLSENFSIAKRFASLNKMIELVPGAKGCFSLAGLLTNWFDTWTAKDPYDYEMQDGDWRKESALREAEWLIPGNTTFKLLEIKEKDGIIIYKVESI